MLQQQSQDKQFYLQQMHRNLNYGSHHIETDTFMSSTSSQPDHDHIDKSLHKAIKQNNAELIVPKEREGNAQVGLLYDQEKELSQVVINMRKKYDQTKIETALIEKNIKKMEQQRLTLQTDLSKIQAEALNTHQLLSSTTEALKQWEYLAQWADYTQATRQNTRDTLKHDILYYKKQCFDNNIRLIRTNTHLRSVSQRSTQKKHIKSKCKLVLNSLQQTVQTREVQRAQHLEEVQDLIRKKLENTQLKTNREQFLEMSMVKALQDKLPNEKFMLQKLHCQLFLRDLLRNKMKKIIDTYKEVEMAYNTIKKATRIVDSNEFIDEFIRKEQKYGDLLQSIEKAEKKIQVQKEEKKQLQALQQQLQYEAYELEKLTEVSPHKETINQFKLLNSYNEQLLNSQKLQILMRRYAMNTFIKFRNVQNKHHQDHNFAQYAKEFQGVSLKKLMINNLSKIQQTLEAKEELPEQVTPDKKSEMTTQRTEDKIKLRDLTGEPVLSKEYSRRNFRVKTVATAHQDAFEQQDHEYSEASQFDYLKYNRRLAKKNNKVGGRKRIQTKAH